MVVKTAQRQIQERSAFYPFLTIRGDLLFPDGNGGFERIDDITAGVKCFGTMWTGDHDDHAGLADLQATKTVCYCDTVHPPALLCLLNNGADLRDCHLFVGVVLKVAHLFATSIIA